MRSPSRRICSQSAAIYRAVKGQDAAGGASYSYPSLTATMPCSAQGMGYEEIVDETGRLTQYRVWRLFFRDAPGVGTRDKIVFNEPSGTSHTVYVQASRDEGGRGAAFAVRATERI